MSLLLGFSGIELALELLSPNAPNVGVVKVRTPDPWIQSDDGLGYRPVPDTVVKSMAKYQDRVLYRATYTIDTNGMRVTPGSVRQGPTYLFVGDSYMFGEGVEDAETLPAQFARRLQPAAHVVNAAAPGYGPTHILRALETGRYDPLVVGNLEAVVVFASVPQLWRVTGDSSWLGNSPRYALDADGRPYYTGTFNGHRWADPLDGMAYLARNHIALVRRAIGPALEREQATLYLTLLRRIKELVQARYGAPLIILDGGPEPPPPGQPVPVDLQYLPAFDAIRALDTPMVSVHRTLGLLPRADWSEYFIPHDGHPKPTMHAKLADALFALLADRGQ
jgi:hypothetical protein